MSIGLDLYFKQMNSSDDNERYIAFQDMMQITEENVTWFDDYKDELLKKLEDKNSFQRSIGLMLLCNLAKSKKNKSEFGNILNRLMLFVDDEKFITQRQYLQSIWKVAIVDDKYKLMISNQLEHEFFQCVDKPHYNLLRQDIITSLKKISKCKNDIELNRKINILIEKEEDLTNRKKLVKLIKED